MFKYYVSIYNMFGLVVKNTFSLLFKWFSLRDFHRRTYLIIYHCCVGIPFRVMTSFMDDPFQQNCWRFHFMLFCALPLQIMTCYTDRRDRHTFLSNVRQISIALGNIRTRYLKRNRVDMRYFLLIIAA